MTIRATQPAIACLTVAVGALLALVFGTCPLQGHAAGVVADRTNRRHVVLVAGCIAITIAVALAER